MVAILWDQGLNGATVQLENLWNDYKKKESLTLYCAYPKSGFTQDAVESLSTICCTHAKIINGEMNPSTEVHYKASTQ